MEQSIENVNKIKKIISEFGSFGVMDLPSEDIITMDIIGNLVTTKLELFHGDYVTVRVYLNENNEDFWKQSEIKYEDLDEDTIEKILNLAEKWKNFDRGEVYESKPKYKFKVVHSSQVIIEATDKDEVERIFNEMGWSEIYNNDEPRILTINKLI